MLDWHKNKKSKNYRKPKNFQPTPTLTGQKQGLATCIMHSQMKHTTQMIRQSMVHPTTTGTHQNGMHTMAHNTKHTTTKNALAHYRVLKQHQHTHQPDHHSPASQAASLQATHNINQKSNSRSTTVYPAVTLCSFSIPPDQPLRPLRSNGWIYNHEP